LLHVSVEQFTTVSVYMTDKPNLQEFLPTVPSHLLVVFSNFQTHEKFKVFILCCVLKHQFS